MCGTVAGGRIEQTFEEYADIVANEVEAQCTRFATEWGGLCVCKSDRSVFLEFGIVAMPTARQQIAKRLPPERLAPSTDVFCLK